MLFSYLFCNHRIHDFQELIKHLVKDVWCAKTDPLTVNDLHPKLKEIVESVYDFKKGKPRGKAGDLLWGPIISINAIFLSLSDTDITKIAGWFDINNEIEVLCSSTSSPSPCTYDDLRGIHSGLAAELKEFSVSLYQDILGLAAVKRNFGSLQEHYNDFIEHNAEDLCPYCGIYPLKRSVDKREAYDHYLPKSQYPFNTVNFKNLNPICHECNSTYKRELDPIRQLDKKRRSLAARSKTFYSYSPSNFSVDITIDIKQMTSTKVRTQDIDISFTATGHDEELRSWLGLFDIAVRYKDKLSGKNDGVYWLTQILDECRNIKASPSDVLSERIRSAKISPWADDNFLRAPFLEACDKLGLIK